MIKKFYINAAVFAVLFAGLLICLDILSMHDATRELFAKLTDSAEYIAENTGPDEVKPLIERAGNPGGGTKLIIGDSVCRQMFSGLNDYNGDIEIMACNGAITVAGQYLLAREYLESRSNVTDVFLIILPRSVSRGFSTDWGYQYVVMPFVETDRLKYLEQSTIDILGNTYGRLFLKPGVVRMIDKSAVNRKIYLNMLGDYSKGYGLKNPFELADVYVWKIYEMCRDKGVTFHLYPCPVSEAERGAVETMRAAFEKSRIREINPDYLDTVCYYPAVESADNTHFSGEYANQENYNKMIREAYEGTELLEMLRFE